MAASCSGAGVAAKHLLGHAMIGRVATLAPGTTKGAFGDLDVLVDDVQERCCR